MIDILIFSHLFLLCASLVIIINSLIFMRGRILKAVLFNFISVLMLVFSGVLSEWYGLTPVLSELLFISGAILYPPSMCYLVKNLTLSREMLSLRFFYFIVSGVVLLHFFSQEYKYLLNLPLFLAGILYLTANFKDFYRGRIATVAFFAAFAGFAVSTVLILTGFAGWMIIACALASCLVFLIITMSFRLRIDAALNQVKLLFDMNQSLARNVSRYRQSNEQCRKIIVERELELFQMSRHASLAEITAGIAHELSQPLTGIKGIAQNMIDDINYDEFEPLQAVSELTRISFLVDKSSSIIDHIRNFSRKKAFSMKKVDINGVIMDAIDLIRVQIKKKEIELLFILDDKIPLIEGDSISIEQLIVNMVLNSRDAILERYSSERKKDGIITISTYSKDKGVVISIEDNGMGMSEEVVQKMWSPFFTTKKKDYGTGVGLSLIKKILNEHNALVEVSSRRGEGTVFKIFFPSSDRESFKISENLL